MNVGIIGYGSMGKMLLNKFADANIIEPDCMYVSNRTQEKLKEADGKAMLCKSNRVVAQNSDILFLCIRPTDMKTVLTEIQSDLKPSTLLVSLNGSISLDLIQRIIKHKTAKVIPSVNAEINKSQTLVCYNNAVTPDDKLNLNKLLDILGDVIELPENEMGMGAELVSCMPGFIASIFDVICREAKKHTDIPEDQIAQMVLRTVCATGELMLTKQLAFHEVVERVATKGGITAEGSKVRYSDFPDTAAALFEATLNKRRQTADNASKQFSG